MHFVRRLFSFRINHPTLSGLWYAFFWMLLGALILSLLLHASLMEEEQLSLYSYIVHSIALLFGGLVSGKRSGKKGLYQGAITGLFYGVLLLLISFLALDHSIKLMDLVLLLPAILIASTGGVFGVNLRK